MVNKNISGLERPPFTPGLILTGCAYLWMWIDDFLHWITSTPFG